MLGETKLGTLAWLLRDSNERDVLEQIGTISSVLAAVNAKVVLFVEDGDRTGGKDFDHGHLERLLWRLRGLDRVSTVIALDHTRAQIDLSGSSHKCVHDSAPSRSATPWKEAADVFVPANQR